MSQFNSDVPPMPAEQPHRGPKGLAVTSLVLGICGFIPLLGFFTAITGIVLGAVSLVKRKAGRGLAIGGIVTGCAGIILAPLIAISILMPVVTHTREAANQAVCRSNLRAIGLALQIYAGDEDGKFPPNLQVLVSEDYGLDSKSLRCPSAEPNSGREGASDYFYLPSASVDDDPTKFLACDLKSNHRKGRNVLYLDCRVEFLDNEDFRAELKLPCNSAFAEALRQKERSPSTQPSNSASVARADL